ncbi:MAG: tRNA lysidine(34) synthetase TilS [Pseudomonadota bacterium]
MASSRKRKLSNAASIDLPAHLRARLQSVLQRGDRLLLGLSGGIDSVVMLDVLAKLAVSLDIKLNALHVNHQLSAHAAAWAQFCRIRCADLGVRLRVVKVEVTRGNSVERAARDARYAALRACAADWIVLAHNADDQAETVLLQLFRGAGVKGLAAMPFIASNSSPGVRGRATAPLLRPLLDVPRAQIEQYAAANNLQWIDDESNTDTAYTRNWLRRDLLPRLAHRVPGYRATLTRAASNFGEAAELLDALACIDVGVAPLSGRFTLAHLRQLTPARAKNLLRFVIAEHGWAMPDADSLNEALRQTLSASADARVCVNLGECELRRQGAVIHLLKRATKRERGEHDIVTWEGQRTLHLPSLGGVLTMTPRRGAGLSTARLQSAPVTIRVRVGGERLQPDSVRPTRTVKNLLQEARVPAWERERLPCIYSGDQLACVPGVATDHRFCGRRGEPSVLPAWRVT